MKSQRELLRYCFDELKAGRRVVRAVILKTWGSTPREAGADLVVDCAGGLHGTVGGGCGEAEVYELALQLLEQAGRPDWSVLHVDLTENPDDGGGKVCGGRFDVLLQVLEPDHHLALMERLVQATETGSAVVLRSSLGTVEPGFWRQGESCMNFLGELSVDSIDGQVDCRLEPREEATLFLEPVGLVRTLVIVGAGHIARPLCEMATLAGYRVMVLDDRSEYARREFFPDAHRVLCGSYAEFLPSLCEAGLVSVVLVTRGHRHDQDCLRLVVDLPLEYVGMIGSQRRVEAVFSELRAEGVRADALARVRAPIGLEIGAQTPAEISISILAEMIQMVRTDNPERKSRPRVRHIRSLSDGP